MKCRVQVIMETDAGEEIHDIACLERNANRLEESASRSPTPEICLPACRKQ
jgi:hypothetical protein